MLFSFRKTSKTVTELHGKTIRHMAKMASAKPARSSDTEHHHHPQQKKTKTPQMLHTVLLEGYTVEISLLGTTWLPVC